MGQFIWASIKKDVGCGDFKVTVRYMDILKVVHEATYYTDDKEDAQATLGRMLAEFRRDYPGVPLRYSGAAHA